MRVNLTQDDSGQTRIVQIGDEITVVLEENPTTGYRWHADTDTDPARLEPTADSYQGPERPIGASGTRHLTFTARQPGPVRLRVVKRRSWEQAAVAEFAVVLDVVSE